MAAAIVVTSGKGGTGKTTVTGGVASCLAALGKRVLCLDMDVGRAIWTSPWASAIGH